MRSSVFFWAVFSQKAVVGWFLLKSSLSYIIGAGGDSQGIIQFSTSGQIRKDRSDGSFPVSSSLDLSDYRGEDEYQYHGNE